MTAPSLFAGLFVPEAVREATSDRAWIQAMLDFEAALARAEAAAGVIPAEAAEAIGAACQADRFDPGEIGEAGRGVGNPAAPLVKALTAAVPDDAAGYVHWGATSQDVVDSAMMLIAKRALGPIDADLAAVADACERLAEEHRSTPMVARSLLQHALPTTFGLKAAGWMRGVDDARGGLAALRFPVQFGGAAGTLASVGPEALKVLAALADDLGLLEPSLPWHTIRHPVAELGAMLAIAAGAVEKIAVDVKLLAQTEVGEVSESSEGDRGGSSTLPHKRNPVGSALAIGCAHGVRGATSVLLASMAQEHERSAGAWHAEWQALTQALALTGGAAFSIREALESLEVHPERMRENLDASGGLIMAESAAMTLAQKVGRHEAQRIVKEASRSGSVRDGLSEHLSPEELDRALDPDNYTGQAAAFVDRALARHREGT